MSFFHSLLSAVLYHTSQRRKRAFSGRRVQISGNLGRFPVRKGCRELESVIVNAKVKPNNKPHSELLHHNNILYKFTDH